MGKKKNTASAGSESANEATAIPQTSKAKVNKDMKHLDGLHEYYHAQTKKELTPFVAKAYKRIKDEFGDNARFIALTTEADELAEKFDSTKEKNFTEALTIAGRMVSICNSLIS